MSEELKPCPFCGGEALLTDVLDDWGKAMYTIGCYKCDAMPSVENERTKEKAIKIWNTRPAEDEWKTAVIDKCAVYHSAVFEDDPKKTLDTLLSVNASWALDPQISQDAANLVLKHQVKAFDDAIAIVTKSLRAESAIVRRLKIAREERNNEIHT